jgi:pyruvate formate lyase activating enzyme
MGLKHVYTGNVHDTEGSSTYCTNCGKRLIERDWYQLGDWHLTNSGQCEYCKTPLTGRFNGPPGIWGCKRQPVYI